VITKVDYIEEYIKHPVLIKEDYTIYFQYKDDYIIVHCDVDRWSKTVMNRLILDSFYLFKIQEKPIYAFHDVQDKKHLKFITRMGFTSVVCEVSTEDGNRLMFQWEGI
jgi:hypothetical protein